MHDFLRVLLAIWAVGYPVVACGPLLLGATQDAPGVLIGGVLSLFLGTALLGPWIAGLVILGVLTVVTRPPAALRPTAGDRVVVRERDPRAADAAPGTAAPPVPPRRAVSNARFVDARLIWGIALLVGGVIVLVAILAGWLR